MPITTQGRSDGHPISDDKKEDGARNLFGRFPCSALATDYDGTLATHGTVDEGTRAALRRFRASGRKAILVTGRRIADLAEVHPHLDDFDAIVAENGALLYWPGARREVPLAEPPPAEFVQFLVKADVRPIELGRVIIATVEPHQHAVLEAIRTFGLELQVIFNKGCVMILPSGVNKATGLKRALKVFGIPREQVVGVGDAENDHALLDFCGLSAAVANALPALKERASIVLARAHGEGVMQLIALILGDASNGLTESGRASARAPAAAEAQAVKAPI
jgi:hydroxymethylpyrimidine pyrophosphatase-like HAD family hydrolase